MEITGHGIHMAVFRTDHLFTVASPGDAPAGYRDGGINQAGTVFGSYIHGLFNNTAFTRRMIDNLCSLRNLRPWRAPWTGNL
jgi:adenosylcobyric acid synthase